eukprot:TRINITY_DN2158_c0_g1_i1.p1 TRINITY_DN2158_c0_g1~~TRINITY_DN2158_c0_g1_i1.p1  ORF type:complete len:363 (+),score=105.52 TRINITY_DN2158_c0_g1_i1:2421-3509(+)
MSAAEVKERVAQLARIKRLRLSEEIKNKRIAKIKSKLYHKIKRKNKEREEKLLMQQLEQIDPETAKKLKLKEEENRVEERMRMRHSMKGKYAKNLMRFAGIKDEAAKEGIKDLLRVRDEIKMKKIELPEEEKEDEDVISEEEEEGSENSQHESENDPSSQKEEDSEVEEESPKEIRIDFSEKTKGKKKGKKSSEKETGLLALKFMKDANKREEEEIKEHAALMQEMAQEEPEVSEEEDENKEQIQEKTKGRTKITGTESSQYSLKKLPQKIKSITEENTENKYSGWTVEPTVEKKKKPKKITELNLTTNDEALAEIEEEMIQRKPSLGAELIEGLEEEEQDAATKDLVQRAVAVANTVLLRS